MKLITTALTLVVTLLCFGTASAEAKANSTIDNTAQNGVTALAIENVGSGDNADADLAMESYELAYVRGWGTCVIKNKTNGSISRLKNFTYKQCEAQIKVCRAWGNSCYGDFIPSRRGS